MQLGRQASEEGKLLVAAQAGEMEPAVSLRRRQDRVDARVEGIALLEARLDLLIDLDRQVDIAEELAKHLDPGKLREVREDGGVGNDAHGSCGKTRRRVSISSFASARSAGPSRTSMPRSRRMSLI